MYLHVAVDNQLVVDEAERRRYLDGDFLHLLDVEVSSLVPTPMGEKRSTKHILPAY